MRNAKPADRRTSRKNSRKSAPSVVKADTAPVAPRTVRNTRVISRDDARAQLSEQGLSISEWARTHGVAYQTVRKVLAGHNAGQFGEAHKVAVLLRLKKGTAVV